MRANYKGGKVDTDTVLLIAGLSGIVIVFLINVIRDNRNAARVIKNVMRWGEEIFPPEDRNAKQ